MEANDEIERILSEDPIETNNKIEKKKQITKIKTYGKSTKVSRKNLMIGAGVIVVLIILGIILFPGSCESEICDLCAQEVSVDTIKQQIITQGYASINDGANVLKLSPYTG